MKCDDKAVTENEQRRNASVCVPSTTSARDIQKKREKTHELMPNFDEYKNNAVKRKDER